jgi:hypothetical protein
LQIHLRGAFGRRAQRPQAEHSSQTQTTANLGITRSAEGIARAIGPAANRCPSRSPAFEGERSELGVNSLKGSQGCAIFA